MIGILIALKKNEDADETKQSGKQKMFFADVFCRCFLQMFFKKIKKKFLVAVGARRPGCPVPLSPTVALVLGLPASQPRIPRV
ncbi:hypothetical protein T4E_2347 [Trichinella pseudospiralis]|uniref:Uncharacterized protein n=1 Tax=Trichinella pseudospiralis TaxID=6337 RepID=A0A0V0Y2U6_TRIPS|nr:hypothetical protein T4E_2347 [Trichinella pseudospiralis]